MTLPRLDRSRLLKNTLTSERSCKMHCGFFYQNKVSVQCQQGFPAERKISCFVKLTQCHIVSSFCNPCKHKGVQVKNNSSYLVLLETALPSSSLQVKTELHQKEMQLNHQLCSKLRSALFQWKKMDILTKLHLQTKTDS